MGVRLCKDEYGGIHPRDLKDGQLARVVVAPKTPVGTVIQRYGDLGVFVGQANNLLRWHDVNTVVSSVRVVPLVDGDLIEVVSDLN